VTARAKRAHQPGEAHGQQLQLRLNGVQQLAANLYRRERRQRGRRACQSLPAALTRMRAAQGRACHAVSGTVSIMTPPATTHTAARGASAGQG
jgi:hypothetical protein